MGRGSGRWSESKAAPLPGKVAGLVSLMLWIGIVSLGRWIGFEGVR
jgi:hypothetical protein